MAGYYNFCCCYSNDNGEVTYATMHRPCIRFLWLYEFQVWKCLDSSNQGYCFIMQDN